MTWCCNYGQKFFANNDFEESFFILLAVFEAQKVGVGC